MRNEQAIPFACNKLHALQLDEKKAKQKRKEDGDYTDYGIKRIEEAQPERLCHHVPQSP